jgi:hypothetical protein
LSAKEKLEIVSGAACFDDLTTSSPPSAFWVPDAPACRQAGRAAAAAVIGGAAGSSYFKYSAQKNNFKLSGIRVESRKPPIAQLVEQSPLKRTVVGSTPTGRTRQNECIR